MGADAANNRQLGELRGFEYDSECTKFDSNEQANNDRTKENRQNGR